MRGPFGAPFICVVKHASCRIWRNPGRIAEFNQDSTRTTPEKHRREGHRPVRNPATDMDAPDSPPKGTANKLKAMFEEKNSPASGGSLTTQPPTPKGPTRVLTQPNVGGRQILGAGLKPITRKMTVEPKPSGSMLTPDLIDDRPTPKRGGEHTTLASAWERQ
eukprot:981158-Prymnesium_polylepis.1